MGYLAHFDLVNLRGNFGLVSFVETGTGDGSGVAAAAAAGFKPIYSVELLEELATVARIKFGRNQDVWILNGDSRVELPGILEKLPPGPCLFWLDAHFAGADYGMGEYDGDKDLGRRMPLREELLAIAKARPQARDVILIDDARLFRPGPYGAGDLPAEWPPLAGIERSLDFVRALYPESAYGMVVDYADQGYVMICPRRDPIALAA
jgi:hypothetical protein